MDASGLPPGYVRLEKLKKMEEWPEEHREWPSPANHDLYRHFPSGRPGWGWYSVWQIIPKAMSKLAKVLGTAWIGCCKVQIMIVDGEGVRRHLIIGWRNQYNELVGTDLLRGHVQAMAERHGFSSEGQQPSGQASGSASQWTTREAGSDWRGPWLEAGASTAAPASGPSGAASTVGTWPDLLSYVAEEDAEEQQDGEFEDAHSEEALSGAVAALSVGGVTVVASPPSVAETAAERQRRLAAEAAMRRLQ